ncbi:DUF4097 family beta strand repeat-containing protein [Thermoflavimicrobium daqui]|uniref:Uncharacterized protein n=1 Tax=Thermoflavimicrobium daqui TaxID=2137476 RepID=A0A364K0Z6_9BACL|nr:hypothetical protein DL897_17370 [Thermoflavimicrobium daqui]
MGFQGDHLRVYTTAGKQILSNIDATIDSESTAGSIEIDSWNNIKGNNQIQATAGSINVRLGHKPSSLYVDLETTAGSISLVK